MDTKGLRENNDIVDSENKKLTPIGLGFQNFQVPEGGMGIQFYFPYPNDVIKKKKKTSISTRTWEGKKQRK